MRSFLPAAFAVVLVLGPAVARADEPEGRRLLILTGANNHDWKTTTVELKQILESVGKFRVEISDDPDASALSDPDKLKKYDGIVLNLNRGKRWAPEREKALLDYVKGGGGLIVFHAANNAFDGWDDYDKLVGGTWRSRGTAFPDRGTFHPARGPYEVEVVDREHPITKGLRAAFTTDDEKYSNLKLQEDIHVLAQATEQGKPQPLLFVLDYGKGRVFHTALGHDVKAMQTPEFRETLARGALWATGKD